MSATTYSFTANITPDRLTFLTENNYNMCFAKMVNGVFNVVWTGNGNYLSSNTFTWTESYAVSASANFQAGVSVKATTAVAPIGIGQLQTLNSAGLWSGPSTDPNPEPGSFRVDNEKEDLTFCVYEEINSPLTGTSTSPIFVNPNETATGRTLFTPIETIMIFFDQQLSTSAMFSDASTAVFTYTYPTGVFSASATYELSGHQSIWVQDSLDGTADAALPLRYNVKTGFTVEPIAYETGVFNELVGRYASRITRKTAGKVTSPTYIAKVTVKFENPLATAVGLAFISHNLNRNLQISAPVAYGNVISLSLGWNHVTLLRGEMPGKTDYDKITSAFARQLTELKQAPVSVQFSPVKPGKA